MSRWMLWLVVVCVLAGPLGCRQIERGMAVATVGRSIGGEFQVEGFADQRTRLTARFNDAFYTITDRSQATIVLLEGTLDDPRQVAVVRIMWIPISGATPVDANATNATINYMVFTGEEDVGVYTGAGFALPAVRLGESRFGVNFRQGILRLDVASEHFADLLGPAEFSGRFVARHRQDEVEPALRQLSQTLRQRLGFPRLVLDDTDAHPNPHEALQALLALMPATPH